MIPSEDQSIPVIIGIVIAEWSQHLASPKGRASVCGMSGTANVNRVILGEGGQGPGDVVPFMLTRMQPEVKDGPPQKGADDGLLKGGNNAGMDSGIHQSILNGVEAVGEDVIVLHDMHVMHDGHWCLVCMSGWRREEVSQLSFCLFVNVSI